MECSSELGSNKALKVTAGVIQLSRLLVLLKIIFCVRGHVLHCIPRVSLSGLKLALLMVAFQTNVLFYTEFLRALYWGQFYLLFTLSLFHASPVSTIVCSTSTPTPTFVAWLRT